jgi:cell division transport system ATP-binding protein
MHSVSPESLPRQVGGVPGAAGGAGPRSAVPETGPGQPQGGAPLVTLARVSRRYGRLVALRDVSLAITPGEFVFVTGPSEAGKTTLLKLIHGDLRPSKGAIRVDGFRLERRWRRFLPRLRRSVAAVFQDHRLLPDMSARANVAFALQVSDLWLPRREVRTRAQLRLDEVGLGKRPGAYPHQLSGGQQRRLAIARALVPGPVLLLADEPTAGLDRRNAERVIELLERCCQAGTTVVVATHDLGFVESRGHRVIELREGQVVADRPATAPISSNGAAARLILERQRRRAGLRARVARVAQFALGYTPPPLPPPRPERTRPGLRARAARIVQVALGHQPQPAVGHRNGAWKAPGAVVERLAPNGGLGGSSRLPPAPVLPPPPVADGGAWQPPRSVAALAAVKPTLTNGKTNGAASRNGWALQLQVRARVARLTRTALGYRPPPVAVNGESRPRVGFRGRAARIAQFVLGYTPPPPTRRPERHADAALERRRRRRPWVPVLNLGRLCVGGAVASWTRNIRTVAPALGSIAMLLAVAGGLAVGGFALRTLLVTQSQEAAVLHVYLSDDAASDQVDQAHRELAALPHVRSVRYIDKDQALQLARKRPGLGDLASASDSNPFPASLEVQVDQPSDAAAVAGAAAKEPGVDSRRPTSYDAGTYDRLRQFTVVATAIAGGFGLLMLAITYAISSNSIRTAVLARRDELLTMQLVGASRWLIRTRLGVEGALTGGLAGLIAAAAVVGASAACFYAAHHLFVQLLPGVTSFTVAGVVAAVTAAGIALGSVSALFAFRRLRT